MGLPNTYLQTSLSRWMPGANLLSNRSDILRHERRADLLARGLTRCGPSGRHHTDVVATFKKKPESDEPGHHVLVRHRGAPVPYRVLEHARRVPGNPQGRRHHVSADSVHSLPATSSIAKRPKALGFKEQYELTEWTLMGSGDILLLCADGVSEHIKVWNTTKTR